MYAQHWDIIPNLAIDFLVPWTFAFIPLHVAGRIMLAATLLLPVIGTVAYSRAMFGGRSFWPLGSFLVAYNFLFLLGFHNLLLSYGLALLSAALFYKLLRGSVIVSSAVMVVCTIVTFFTHIAGLGLLLALIFVHKAFYALESWPDWRAVARKAIVQGAGFAVILLGPIALYTLSPFADTEVRNLWIIGPYKLNFLLSPVLNYYSYLDLATAALLMCGFVVCVLSGRVSVSAATCLLLGALFIAYPYLPFILKTGAYVDVRLTIFMGFLLFCAFIPRNMPRPIIIGVGLLFASLFVLRTAVVAYVWYGHNQDLADVRHAIQPVEPGSRVLAVVVPGPGIDGFMEAGDPALQPGAAKSRYISLIGLPTYWHMPGLLLMEKRAYWPLLFAADNKQPVRVLPPYREISDPAGHPPFYEGLAVDDLSASDLQTYPYVAHWRSQFDYVLVLNAQLAGDLGGFLPDRLEFMEQTGFAALFRVRKQGLPVP